MVMKDPRAGEIVPKFKRILDDWVVLKPGEKVVVLTDTASDGTLVDVAYQMCVERGAETIITTMAPRARVGDWPPEAVVAAIKASTLVFEITTIWAMPPGLRTMMKTNGIRMTGILGATIDTFAGITGLDVDFDAMKKWGAVLAARFGKAKKIRVTSRMGTDLTASKEGRIGRLLELPPDFEVSAAPVEGTSEGVIVVDTHVSGQLRVQKPFKVYVKKGRIVEIESADEPAAFNLEQSLKSYNDPNMYNIAEIAMGYNTKCHYRHNSLAYEREGTIGIVHFGIGDNVPYGGSTPSAAHYDVQMREGCEFYLDDECVLKDGKILIPGAP